MIFSDLSAIPRVDKTIRLVKAYQCIVSSFPHISALKLVLICFIRLQDETDEIYPSDRNGVAKTGTDGAKNGRTKKRPRDQDLSVEIDF
jgi:hypothetical protein